MTLCWVGLAAAAQAPPTPTETPAMVGNSIALVGSFGAVFAILANTILRPMMPAPVQFGLIVAIQSVMLLPIIVFAYGTPLDASRNGLFGWTRAEPDRLGALAYIVLIADSIGSLGWVVSLKYFSPLTVSVVILLLPIAAMVEGVLTGLKEAPSFVSILGSLTLIVGTLEVVVASSGAKEEAVDATEALADPAIAQAVANAGRASASTNGGGASSANGGGGKHSSSPDFARRSSNPRAVRPMQGNEMV
jgi:drug/metabolite transporter (DMT)-like permease